MIDLELVSKLSVVRQRVVEFGIPVTDACEEPGGCRGFGLLNSSPFPGPPNLHRTIPGGLRELRSPDVVPPKVVARCHGDYAMSFSIGGTPAPRTILKFCVNKIATVFAEEVDRYLRRLKDDRLKALGVFSRAHRMRQAFGDCESRWSSSAAVGYIDCEGRWCVHSVAGHLIGLSESAAVGVVNLLNAHTSEARLSDCRIVGISLELDWARSIRDIPTILVSGPTSKRYKVVDRMFKDLNWGEFPEHAWHVPAKAAVCKSAS